MSEPLGAIHDIGYQRYTGVRLGRPYARRSLYVHGIRTAFGLGRSGKAKIFPWFAASVLLLIAVIVVVIRSQTGTLGIHYVEFPERGTLLVLIFLATAAPELVSRDLRSKVLPLYFSRPLGRGDYVWAKLAALVSSVFVILAVPMLVIFLGGAFSLHGSDVIWREFTDFLGGLGAAAVTAILYSVVALLIASLVARRMLAAAAIVGVFLVTSAVGAAITVILQDTSGGRWGNIIGPQLLATALNQWSFGGDPKNIGSFGYVYLIAAVILTAVCAGLLLVRYRKVAA
jgi:ABC-2 type transport system permease protein